MSEFKVKLQSLFMGMDYDELYNVVKGMHEMWPEESENVLWKWRTKRDK